MHILLSGKVACRFQFNRKQDLQFVSECSLFISLDIFLSSFQLAIGKLVKYVSQDEHISFVCLMQTLPHAHSAFKAIALRPLLVSKETVVKVKYFEQLFRTKL